MAKVEVIILRETLADSVAKDLFSAFVLLGMVGLGIWIGSAALQWVAGIMWILWMPTKAFSYFKDNKVTVAEARAKLDALEGK